MSKNDNWTLGLIDSASFCSDFDPGRMSKTNRERYVAENQSAGMPIVSLVCTCLGLSDFNPAIRDYHIERTKNVVDLGAEFASVRNLCFVPGEYMFQKKLIPAKSEWISRSMRRSGGRACA
jgi:D-psicose/D-tagatose/L-ribulose 3-epimerase